MIKKIHVAATIKAEKKAMKFCKQKGKVGNLFNNIIK